MKKPRPLRMYEALWLAIKANPDVAVTVYAPEPLHKRVKKALEKERHMASAGWADSLGYTLVIRTHSSVALTAKLVTAPGLSITQSLRKGEPLFYSVQTVQGVQVVQQLTQSLGRHDEAIN